MSFTSLAAPITAADRLRLLRGWSIALLLWLIGVVALSASGILPSAVEAAPTLTIPALVAAGMIIPLIAVARSPRMKALLLAAQIASLTLFNIWRIPAAFVFYGYGAAGLLPETFVLIAATGDLIAGALAPVTIALARRLPLTARRRAYLVFHIVSFTDFVVAVGTGITLTLLQEPLMASLAEFPLALIPLFGVPVTGSLTLIALWRLTRRPVRSLTEANEN